MNNFPAMTEAQRTELVQFNRAIIAQHEAYAVSEAGWPDDVRLLVSSARIALAALTAEKRLTVSVVQKNERLKGFNFEGYDSLPAGEHEFYTAPSAPVLRVPDGWKLVPIEPTEDMVIRGFESKPDQFWSTPEEWAEYEAMSGCQQAAHKARLCYAAMLAAAPEA